MSFDLLVRDAALADGRRGVDVGVRGGRIVAIAPALPAEHAGEVIEARGRLLSAPLVDAHFHMDAALSLGLPRLNASGTLLEGIALWGELKPHLTVEAVVQRALAYCDMAAAQGLLHIRSHVDVCDPRLLAVDALLEVKRQVAGYIDLQLVAFPQDGYLRAPGAIENLQRALDRGVDVIGGIPHFERTMADGADSIARLCRLAAERGLRVDMHCDESDDPHSRHVETLAAETIRHGLQGRVTGSHLTSMHSMDNYYVSKLLPLMAEARLSAVANPLINITLQGRHDSYPKRRGMTRVPELLAAGIDVALGQDCCMDPWYSFGSADMLEVASMAVHVAQMTSQDGIRACYAGVTDTAARVIGLDDYGLREGGPADFVLLQAADPFEAIRLKAARLAVVRRGRVIARAPERQSSLELPGRPPQVSLEFVPGSL
ncbi:MAG: amidohydrolase family protein [Xanthomonadales bacterium]|nr:amidohydrolase family protein [Xanthomonadales bacterium]